ncbi:hypothetical protein [Allostella humosa]|uniref:hypothetical protein n=1 Tax=Stella humosa TaxID=94 RepID=UPI0014773474|nr:hypothetical protein [Stella humosa]
MAEPDVLERDPAVQALVVRLYRDEGMSVTSVAERAGLMRGKATRVANDRVRRILVAAGVPLRAVEVPRYDAAVADAVPRQLAPWPAEARFDQEVADREAGVYGRVAPAATHVDRASSAAWAAL